MRCTLALSFLAFAVLLTAYLDGLHYAARKADVAQVREARGMEPARIWSRKCARQGKQVYAAQADGGKWRVECVK